MSTKPLPALSQRRQLCTQRRHGFLRQRGRQRGHLDRSALIGDKISETKA